MSIFQKNLSLLKNKNEELANKIENYMVNDIELISGYNNFLTALVKGKMVNSIYNPIEEAKARIDGVSNVENLSIIFNIGFGLGYEVNELLRRVNNRCIIISIVTDLGLLKTAMENMDLSNIFEYAKIAIIDGTIEDFKLYFSQICVGFVYYGQNIEIFKHPVENIINKELNYMIEKDIIDSYIYSTYGIGNAPGDTLEGLENILSNMKHIFKTCDISKLKDRFKGIPAVCVASGPSLNKNLSLLKGIENKAVIFAADTIIERLKKENIKYHAVSVLERPKLIYDKLFKGNPLEEDIVLFGESVIYPKIFEEHKAKNVVLFKNTTTIEEFLPNKMENLNEIPTGYSVAHMNFTLANYLGFSPIILIGQDLAYAEDGHSHAKGTIHENNTIDNDETTKDIDKVYVEGINSNLVKTNRVWKNFLDWFELEIMDKKIFCIDATEGGALINGTKVMSLKNTINDYCNKELVFDFKEFFNDEILETQINRKNVVMDELKIQLQQLGKIKKIIKKEKRLLVRFKEKIDKKYDTIQDINLYIEPINRRIYKILEYPVFAFIVQALSVELGRKNNSMIEIRNKEDCIKWYNNQLAYINDVYGVLKLTDKIIKKGLKK